jgi:hypothetical protein
MKRALGVATAFLALALQAPAASAMQPYVKFETGVVSREVVEEDAAIQGFSFSGTAESTRVLATAGVTFGDVLTVYAQGGGATLSIDDFDGFDASFSGAYGGGARFDFLLSPRPGGLRLFVEGNYLHTTADDAVQSDFFCSAANGCTAPPAAQGEYLARLADETIEWNEYTVLLGGGWRYGAYAPYGGVRLSWVDAQDQVRAAPDANFATEYRVEADLKEQDNFGVFLGTDVFLDRAGKTALNAEVSLFDQSAFRVAIRRAF